MEEVKISTEDIIGLFDRPTDQSTPSLSNELVALEARLEEARADLRARGAAFLLHAMEGEGVQKRVAFDDIKVLPDGNVRLSNVRIFYWIPGATDSYYSENDASSINDRLYWLRRNVPEVSIVFVDDEKVAFDLIVPLSKFDAHCLAIPVKNKDLPGFSHPVNEEAAQRVNRELEVTGGKVAEVMLDGVDARIEYRLDLPAELPEGYQWVKRQKSK